MIFLYNRIFQKQTYDFKRKKAFFVITRERSAFLNERLAMTAKNAQFIQNMGH